MTRHELNVIIFLAGFVFTEGVEYKYVGEAVSCQPSALSNFFELRGHGEAQG